MKEYRKPVAVAMDPAEGVFMVASGTVVDNGIGNTPSGDVSVSLKTANGGQYTFSATMNEAFVGKHVLITFTFDKQLSGGWASAPTSYAGSVFTLENWGVPAEFDFTVMAGEQPELVSATVEQK